LRKKLTVLGALLVLGGAFASEDYKSHEERHSFQKRVEFSVDYWVAIPNGWFAYNGKKLDLRDDFNLKKAKDFGGKIIYDGIEQGWMNIIFTYTPLKFEGYKTMSEDFQFKDIYVEKGKEIETIYDFNNYDLGLLWDIGHLKEKTENRLDIRAGFSIRYLDGSLEIKTEEETFTEEYDKIIPMLDVEAEVEVLPVHQDLTAEVILEYQVYAFDGDWMHDFIDSIRINYKRGFVEGGYRIIKYNLSKGEINTKTTAAGFFASLGIMF